MPFIGNKPADSYLSLEKQTFTTSATASYTLTNAVSNANEIALFLNNVRQEPTEAYSVSGTALTLSTAITSGDTMYCIYLGKSIGTINPADGSVGLSQLSATGTKDATTFLRGDNSFATVVSGLTEADVWRYTASTAAPSGDITANWERADNVSSGLIGTGMTQSSGIFSFSSTGIYLITGSVGFNFANQQDNNANIQINVTIDNSTYDPVAIIFSGSNSSANFSRFSQFGQALVDVTNISLVKVKFAAASFAANSYLEGDTDKNDTSFSFIRLGDT